MSSGHSRYFFDQKLDNGVNEMPSCLSINLMDSFQDTTQNSFAISHPAELEIYYINLELAIEL